MTGKKKKKKSQILNESKTTQVDKVAMESLGISNFAHFNKLI